MESEEKAAGEEKVGAASNGGAEDKSQGSVEAKGELAAGFLAKGERPYHGAVKGRIEDAARDAADEELRNKGESIEDSRLAEGQRWSVQHGNVGFAGSYAIDPLVER